MVGNNVGARNGVFNKGGELLEITQNVNTVVFDKTGTITEGHSRVIKVYAMLLLSSLSLNLVCAIAETVESISERPNGKWTTNSTTFCLNSWINSTSTKSSSYTTAISIYLT